MTRLGPLILLFAIACLTAGCISADTEYELPVPADIDDQPYRKYGGII